MLIFGGAAGGGKSWSLLFEPLKHYRVAGWSGVIFRRTYPEIVAPGGMWDQSHRIYSHIVDAVPRVGDCGWDFPSGAKLRFAHMQHAADVYRWMGSEMAFIGFDELTLFEESQFWFLFSRNRTMCGRRPYIRAGCNPDADSWVAKLLEWWIDQDTGLAIPDRAGRLRWFVRIDDKLEWADSAEELKAKFAGSIPKSLSFIPSMLADNAALMAADPGYLANLMALPLVERERLLGGNWKIRPSAGLIFNRAWFDIVRAAPAQATRVRYWDKASIQGGGDWSAGVKMSREWSTGLFYVEDVVRGQWSSQERNRVIRQTAALDGPDVAVWVEQEPGSGGKESAEITIRDLAGYSVYAEGVTGTKEARARGLSAQAEARNVKLVLNPLRDWIPDYLDELHAFPIGKNDDQVDGSSGAFNKLTLSAVDPWTNDYSRDEGSVVTKAPAGVFEVEGVGFETDDFDKDGLDDFGKDGGGGGLRFPNW